MLHCPPKSTHAIKRAGYKTLAELLVGFNRIGCLLTSVSLSRFEDENGIRNTTMS